MPGLAGDGAQERGDAAGGSAAAGGSGGPLGTHDFVCLEKSLHHGAAGTVTYLKDLSQDGTKPLIVRNPTSGLGRGGAAALHEMFVDAFLPQGFPDSVSPDYLDYQLWDTAQAFCSYITGTLASQAVLKGVGVGDKEATAVGATLTYLMRDVTGMVGRIAFAWAKGTDLDHNAKRWRMAADVLNDVALMLDLMAPWYPSLFVAFVCLSSLTRAVVGVAGGATRAALTMHQARDNNLGDVSAKDGSQETLVNLTAVLVGMVLLPLINEDALYTWCLFAAATACHIYCNWRAVTCLVLEDFNYERLRIAVASYADTGQVPTPAEMSALEPVAPWAGGGGFARLTVGDRFGDSFCSPTEFNLAQVSTRFAPGCKNYLVAYKPDSFQRPTQLDLMAVLHDHAGAEDVLRVHFHGLVVAHAFDAATAGLSSSSSAAGGGATSGGAGEKERSGSLGVLLEHARVLRAPEAHSGRGWAKVMKSSAEYVESNFQNFLAVCSAAGWNTDRVQLTVGPFRCQWSELIETVD